MKNKHFDSYAERVRTAKENARQAMKKVEKPKRKFKTSQVITFVLMVIWSICSVLGVFGFARSFNTKNQRSMRVVGASAAENDSISTSSYSLQVPTVFTYRPQGLLGATFLQSYTKSNGYEYGINAYALTSLEFRIDTASKVFTVRYNDADTITGNGFNCEDTIDLTTTQEIEFYPAMYVPSAWSNSAYNGGSLSLYTPSSFYLNFYVSRGEPVDIPVGYVLDSIDYSCEQETGEYIWIDFNFYNGLDTLTWSVRLAFNTAMNYQPNQYPYLPYYSKQLQLGIKYQEKVSLFSWQDYIDIYEQGQEDVRNNLIGDIEKIKQNAYNDGKQAGYEQGLNESNQYTFSNLISAVIDVPIQSFQSLLNFEILGVNLLAFAESLIFIGLLLFLVKLLI